jgi:hypothetical protein
MYPARQSNHALCALIGAMLFAASNAATANAFRGVWVTRTNLCDNGTTNACEQAREAGATLWLYQFGNRLCGEWSQGIYGGRVWSGNVIGFVQGGEARVRIGQDVQHSASRPYPLQSASPTLFRVRGGMLVWYTDRGATQKRFALRRAEDPLLKAHFNEPEFLRLCRAGVDFQ